MSEALKPCPFCGNPRVFAEELPRGDDFRDVIVCMVCGCEGPYFKTKTPAEAAAAWNRREAEAMIDAYRSLAALARHRDHPGEGPCENFMAVDSEARKIAAALKDNSSPG